MRPLNIFDYLYRVVERSLEESIFICSEHTLIDKKERVQYLLSELE